MIGFYETDLLAKMSNSKWPMRIHDDTRIPVQHLETGSPQTDTPGQWGLVTCYDRPNIWQDARKYTECTGRDVLELRWMSWMQMSQRARWFGILGSVHSVTSASPWSWMHHHSQKICNDGRFPVWNTIFPYKEAISKGSLSLPKPDEFSGGYLSFIGRVCGGSIFADPKPRLSPLLFNGTTWHRGGTGKTSKLPLA